MEAEAINDEQLEEIRKISEINSDITQPIVGRDMFALPCEIDETILTDTFRSVAEDWAPEIDRPERGDILLHFIEHFLPHIPGVLPRACREDTAEFVWAKVRCLIAGAGWPQHKRLATFLCRHHSTCPFGLDETFAEWREALVDARMMCGWPVTLALLDCKVAHRLLGSVDKDDVDKVATNRWLLVLSGLTLCKYVRFDAGFPGELVIIKEGRCLVVECDKATNHIASGLKAMNVILSGLGMPKADGRSKAVPVVSFAIRHMLQAITTSALIQRKPLSDLPPNILAPRWCHPTPSLAVDDSFLRTGCRLSHAWLAENGEVHRIDGDDMDVLNWQWPLRPTHLDQVDPEAFSRQVPSTYTDQLPVDQLLTLFPHIDFGESSNLDAVKAIHDAAIIHPLLHTLRPDTGREFPFFSVLPTSVIPDQTTGQGKTTLAEVISRVWVPGIENQQPGSDSAAPKIRQLLGGIEQHGTLCIDEFPPYYTDPHPLCPTQLQSLCTGGHITNQKVLQNDACPVRLRFPLMVSAKTILMPEDMINRSIPMWLGQIEEYNDDALDQEVLSGRLSTRIRLACVDLIAKHNLDKVPARGTRALRFRVLAGLAVALYRIRTGNPEANEADIDNAMREIHERLRVHSNDSLDTGLAQQLTSRVVVVTMAPLFDVFRSEDLYRLHALLQKHGDEGRVGPSMFLSCIGEAKGIMDCGIGKIVNRLTGGDERVADRAIALSVARDMRRLMPDTGNEWHLPDTHGVMGWRLERCPNRGKNSIRIRLKSPEDEQ